MDIFLIAFLFRNTIEHVWGLNSLPVLLTNPSTYFEKPFKAADPAALFFGPHPCPSPNGEGRI